MTRIVALVSSWIFSSSSRKSDLYAQRHALEFPLVELESGREMVTRVDVEPDFAAPLGGDFVDRFHHGRLLGIVLVDRDNHDLNRGNVRSTNL